MRFARPATGYPFATKNHIAATRGTVATSPMA